jgi:hypothetical protein
MKKTTKQLIESFLVDKPKLKNAPVVETGVPGEPVGEPEEADAKDSIKKILANVDAGKAKALLQELMSDL